MPKTYTKDQLANMSVAQKAEIVNGKAWANKYEEMLQNPLTNYVQDFYQKLSTPPTGVGEVKPSEILATNTTPPQIKGVLPENSGKILTTETVPGETPNTQLSTQPSLPESISQKPRGFINTVENVPNASRKATVPAEKIEPQTYTVMPQDSNFANAKKVIDTQGVDSAHQSVLANTPWTADKAALGQKLMQNYADHIAEPGNYEKFQEITSSMDNQARAAGQGNSILQAWAGLSPKSMLDTANESATKLGQTLPDDFQKQVISRANDIQKMTMGSTERLQATQTLLKDIAEQLPPTAGELFESYRYMNMLSGPVTVGKIGYGGLFNTLVTRPIDLFAEATVQHAHALADSSFQRTVSYSDIPTWYKDSYLGLPDAWDAAIQGWKQGNVEKAFQEGKSAESTIGTLRKQNLPGILTAPGKVHGFIYNFFSSVIGGAERSRLMANGVDEAKATEMGKALGDKFTLRAPLGAKDEATAVKAVDGLGQLAIKMRDIPVLGTFSRWIAPFMKVSTNFVKLGVEHSPLALPDSAIRTIQGQEGADTALAHAMVGSVVTGLGVMAVAKGMTTGAAPSDPTLNAQFYASGRKPYSVNIPGIGWTPYQYLGPLGLSMMLPQEIKDATSGQNIGKNTLDKVMVGIGNVTKMIIAGTPLPSITGFFNMLNGDTSVNPATILADFTSQVIPFEAMARYVAQVVDPIYRKASTYAQRLESGIPILTKQLQPYTMPNGEPESRNITNFVAPYAIGQPNPTYESQYQGRTTKLEQNSLINAAQKNIEAAQGGSQAMGDGKYVYWDSGTMTSKTIDTTPVTSLPENTTYQKALKQSKAYTLVDNILDSGLKSDQQQQALSDLGISQDDASYYKIARQSTDLKNVYVNEDISRIQTGSNNRADLLNYLVGQRKVVNGDQILSDPVVTQLFNDGVISQSEEKQLKALKITNGVTTKLSGRGSKVTIKKVSAPTATTTKAPKIKTMAQLLVKSGKIRTKNYGFTNKITKVNTLAYK
jgi:hypothetical protein